MVLRLILVLAAFLPQLSWGVEIRYIDPAECQTGTKPWFCSRYSKELASFSPDELTEVSKKFPKSDLGQMAHFEEMLSQTRLDRVLIARLGDNPAIDKNGVLAEANYNHTTREGIIVIRPNFFKSENIFLNGVPEKTHTLLHELIHIFNQARGVGHGPPTKYWDGFAKVLGWEQPKKAYPLVDYEKYKQVVNQSKDLKSMGRTKEALEIEFGFARDQGFPSIYAIGSGTMEFFPELIAFLIHDPTLEESLNYDLKEWLNANGFGKLLKSFQSVQQSEYITEAPRVSFEHVGIMYLEARALCTVSILKHGLIVTAKHCFAEVKDMILQNPKAKVMGLSIRFPYGSQSQVITGYSFDSITLDKGDNDLAFITYDKSKTQGRISVPEISVVMDAAGIHPNDNVILASYRIPQKIRRLKMQVQSCQVSSEYGRIDDVLPNYVGDLIGTNCQGYFLSSGAPLYREMGDGSLALLGVLSHTFDIDRNGQVLEANTRQDDWGLTTNTNISLISRTKEKGLLRGLVGPSVTQQVLIQAVEQKLREYGRLLAENSQAAPHSLIQLRVKINVALGLSIQKKDLIEFVRRGLKGQSEVLVEDEMIDSLEPLHADEVDHLISILKGLLK